MLFLTFAITSGYHTIVQRFINSLLSCQSRNVIPNEVRNLRGIDIKRFLSLVEMTVDAFFDFCNYLWISHNCAKVY